MTPEKHSLLVTILVPFFWVGFPYVAWHLDRDKFEIQKLPKLKKVILQLGLIPALVVVFQLRWLLLALPKEVLGFFPFAELGTIGRSIVEMDPYKRALLGMGPPIAFILGLRIYLWRVTR